MSDKKATMVVFRGAKTGRAGVEPLSYYFEPKGWKKDAAFSAPFATREDAVTAAKEAAGDAGEVESI